ncbi:uncharacterized protein LOC130717170 [Lotus japonicus]|uniref:uncharacterized protein LOC130717170 n=1 Tax=Lotus japonicus TaxID=34305 RepID=UPI002590839A|nr:uncharacterized protein LOC130717170 [Lotus japonicus]
MPHPIYGIFWIYFYMSTGKYLLEFSLLLDRNIFHPASCKLTKTLNFHFILLNHIHSKGIKNNDFITIS